VKKLVVDVCSLFDSPKALNFSTNASKLLKNGDCHSNKETNHIKVMFDNNLLRSSTWVNPFG
jgi:hypothetical protein